MNIRLQWSDPEAPAHRPGQRGEGLPPAWLHGQLPRAVSYPGIGARVFVFLRSIGDHLAMDHWFCVGDRDRLIAHEELFAWLSPPLSLSVVLHEIVLIVNCRRGILGRLKIEIAHLELIQV